MPGIIKGQKMVFNDGVKNKPYPVLTQAVHCFDDAQSMAEFREQSNDKLLQEIPHPSDHFYWNEDDNWVAALTEEAFDFLVDQGLSLELGANNFSIKKGSLSLEITEIETNKVIKEYSFKISISDIANGGAIFPLEANPRLPEYQKSLYEGIQKSVTKGWKFSLHNNGFSIFASGIEFDNTIDLSEVDDISLYFGQPGTYEGICNGGFTYFVLSRSGKDNDNIDIGVDAWVDASIVIFTGDGWGRSEIWKLKNSISNAKNTNRTLIGRDSANFHGLFNWMKQCLNEGNGTSQDNVKWKTGEQNTTTRRKIEAAQFIRWLDAIKNDNKHHTVTNSRESRDTLDLPQSFLTTDKGMKKWLETFNAKEED